MDLLTIFAIVTIRGLGALIISLHLAMYLSKSINRTWLRIICWAGIFLTSFYIIYTLFKIFGPQVIKFCAPTLTV
jgi:ABC-type Fe3+ transport system permease subunit